MTAHTSTRGVLAPQLEAIAAAAADRLRGEIAGTDQHEPETHHAVAEAAWTIPGWAETGFCAVGEGDCIGECGQ